MDAVENYRNCIGAQLAAVTDPRLQAWASQEASTYAAWAIDRLRESRYGMAGAMELAAWWDTHPRNPLNSQA